MSAETEHYHLDSNLTLSDASLSLTKLDDQLIECRLTLSVNPELYQRIDTQSLFNLIAVSAVMRYNKISF